MHTTVFKDGVPGDEPDVRIHYNGDWSGVALLQWNYGPGADKKIGGYGELQIPGWVAELLCKPLHDPEVP
jgi:hypothetical protein